jgi:hypothetical protein
MLVKLVLLQISAHLLADFVFQSQKMSDRKSSKTFSLFHLYHFLIVLGCSFFFSFDLNFWKAAVFLSVFHWLGDGMKSWLMKKFVDKNFFFTDQLFHFLVILAVSWIYMQITGWEPWWNISTKSVAVFAGFLLCTKPANIIIQHLFRSFNIQTPDEKSSDNEDLSLPNAGKLIGIVERTLALALILNDQFSAVGLIIAAKSILRFKGARKSEYVLVGTLISFAIATICGILINII